ncbi:7685_t:CDS:1, partial [Gigaspora rosea]
LIKTKEIQLSLIKVKEHSGVVWNKVADQLAKKGSEITDRQRCVIALPPVQSVELYWKNKKVEQPVCEFMKVLMNLKIGLEWRLKEAITKEEPQDRDMKFKWSLL